MWHVLFDFPNSAGTEWWLTLVLFWYVLGWKLHTMPKSHGTFEALQWTSEFMSCGELAICTIWAESKQVVRKRRLCGLQSKQKLWFLNAPLVDSLMAWTWFFELVAFPFQKRPGCTNHSEQCGTGVRSSKMIDRIPCYDPSCWQRRGPMTSGLLVKTAAPINLQISDVERVPTAMSRLSWSFY